MSKIPYYNPMGIECPKCGSLEVIDQYYPSDLKHCYECGFDFKPKEGKE